MVSYPGYDSNKLANGVDSEYFASLQHDKSSPLLNYATQQKTAPGSTFKLVSATAGLAENVITTSDQFRCTGIYNDISNKPKCWIYPGSHGLDNVFEAIRDSCNVFFYTVGNRLAQKKTGSYNDANGIDLIQKYAHIYGLDQKQDWRFRKANHLLRQNIRLWLPLDRVITTIPPLHCPAM